jgi:hypothetical protein
MRPASRKELRARPFRLTLGLLALAASLLLPAVHAAAAHHGAPGGSSDHALVASHGACNGHGVASALDPDTCSLCRAAHQARSLLGAGGQKVDADLDAPLRGLHSLPATSIPASRAVAVAGPRAPPRLLSAFGL